MHKKPGVMPEQPMGLEIKQGDNFLFISIDFL
jgi:hypothetical protein